MRIAVVTVGSIPNPAQSGGALTVWTVVGHLISAGHEVVVLALLGNEFLDPGATLEQRVKQLRSTGADVRIIPSRAERLFETMGRGTRARLGRALRPTEAELFPNLLDVYAVRDAVAQLAPDAVWAYHWEATAASRGLAGVVPRLATVVDLPQFSALYRWRATPGRLSREGLARLLWLQARLRRMPRLMTALLNECEVSADFAAHHAAWLRRHGVSGCEYLRTPVEDRAGADWLAARERHRAKQRARLLLIGHLRGISTLAGLDLFATGVLPRLEAALGEDGFETRIVGGYQAPPHLLAALARPSVRILGYVERAEDEFRAADAVLVPTPIELGARVRILSAFSFGCPVVAHEANRLGIPELVHEDNVLLGRTGAQLADGALRLVRDEALRRRLEKRGRETYERMFTPGVAAAAIEQRLIAVAQM